MMTNDFPGPDSHSQGWRLISRSALCEPNWIDASDADPALLLMHDTNGEWWAVAADCRHCGTALINVLRTDTQRAGRDELQCAQCGTLHGPHVAGCECVALMVVDDEIYAAPDIDVNFYSD